MTVIHKFKSLQNLTSFRTWIVDSDPISTYFQLAQIPTILTAGRNAFLINGSSFLVPTTPVLVELMDALGNVIFSEPIKNYAEGLARVVTIEIYNTTAPGLCTLTILGHISSDVNGTLPPPEFKTAYNVKWEQKILVDPSKNNTTPIRLLNQPSASVSELLNPFRQTSSSIQFLTGSTALSMSGASQRQAILSGDINDNNYIITVSSASFVKEMLNAPISFLIGATPFTSSITLIRNNTTAQISPSFIQNSLISNFITNTFTVSYTSSLVYLVSQYTKSYADIDISRLTTFSGQIAKAKIFASSADSPGKSELLTEATLVPKELFVALQTGSAEPRLNIGNIINQQVCDNYWTSNTMSFY